MGLIFITAGQRPAEFAMLLQLPARQNFSAWLCRRQCYARLWLWRLLPFRQRGISNRKINKHLYISTHQ